MPVLSEHFVKSAPAPPLRHKIIFDSHRDAPRGFGLRITPAGTKSFVLRYANRAGKDRLLTIGQWDDWSLKAARTEAKARRQKLDRGQDLLAAQHQERTEPTASAIFERYWVAQVQNLESSFKVRRMLEEHFLQLFGDRNMRTIRRAEVIKCIEDLAERHPRQAGKVLVYIKKFFAYAEDRELIEGNPVATLKATKFGSGLTSRKRGRILDTEEIQALWNGGKQCGMRRLPALALKFILATGQRPGEVAEMRWSEIDRDIWTIPGFRRKKTELAHTVPLTATAMEILKCAKEETVRLSKRCQRSGDFVFETRRNQPLTTNGLDQAAFRHRKALKNKPDPQWGPWKPHDLRRTMRTGLAALRIEDTTAEQTIGHTRKGIQSVYDLHRYNREKREALVRWESYLLNIVRATCHE